MFLDLPDPDLSLFDGSGSESQRFLYLFVYGADVLAEMALDLGGVVAAGAGVHDLPVLGPPVHLRTKECTRYRTGTKECTSYRHHQRMYQLPEPRKNVPDTGNKKCTRYRYQRKHQLPAPPKNVPGTGIKECTRYRYQRMYQVPVSKNVPGTGIKECTRYRCVRSNVESSITSKSEVGLIPDRYQGQQVFITKLENLQLETENFNIYKQKKT
jgi:hypothetical protein